MLEITEKSTEKEKDSVIKKASSQGSVCTLTKEFGRGTDFISTDEQVNAFVGMVVSAYNTPYVHQQKMYACNSVQTICHWSSVAIQWKQHLFRVLGEFMPVDEHRYAASVNSRVREVFGRRMTNWMGTIEYRGEKISHLMQSPFNTGLKNRPNKTRPTLGRLL